MAPAKQTSSEAQALQPFGKYLLDAELAQGGMARVFRARLRGPGGFEKRLVVKQILPELAQDPRFVELFVREANTLVQMSHPNVVPVYELGVVDGVYFLAMELVEGATRRRAAPRRAAARGARARTSARRSATRCATRTSASGSFIATSRRAT